ncbi:sensor domain-containing protein [Halorientalis pallida]|uniref:Sensor protein n=1 Tax=Halorientalis pallida TaxID=2479928 RepID=A0A498L119_9EURY|nr:sensor domain-containing protein [Halorientalis pallida]RXK49031.1 sensor protein [Halorientalis pallida]
MTRTAAPDRSLTDSLRGFFGVPFRGQTYRSLAYLLLSFPLGLAYFVAVTVGVATGVGLLITLVGVPILLVTLYGVTLIAGFEASLARHLLGMDVPAPECLQRGDAADGWDPGSILAWARTVVTAPTTWTALVLVGVKFVFGLTAFAVLSAAATVSLVLLAAPIAVLTDVPLQVASATDGLTVGIVSRGQPLWVAETLPEAAALAVVGAFATLLTLHLVNGLATFGGVSTAALLDVDGSDGTPA